jgi:molecular chaperone Hsp33
MNADSSQRFIFEHLDVRGELVQLDASYRELLILHHYPAPVAKLLGECLAAAVLLSNSMKSAGNLALQIRGDGPISLLLVECTDRSLVRGIAQLREQAITDDFEKLLTGSLLTLTITPDNGKRHQGIVPLEGANLARCLENYFRQSEQINASFVFNSDGKQCAGMLLQQLPAQLVSDLQEREDQWTRLSLIAQTLSATELLEFTTETLLPRLYPEDLIRLFDSHAIAYSCRCSRARTAKILATVARDEVDKMLQEDHYIDMTCELCNQDYRFDASAVDAIFRGELTQFDEHAPVTPPVPPGTTH